MRSAARRNETAHYTLTVGIPGSASAPTGLGMPPASDAKVKGTPYHASGKVPCSMGDSAPGSSRCEFGVICGAPGNSEVPLTPPGGFERVLTFAGGKVSASEGARVKAYRSKGKAADEKIINAVVANLRVMRQMPQLLREAGLEVVATLAYVVADVGRADLSGMAPSSLLEGFFRRSGQ
jgi:hypothetical protein